MRNDQTCDLALGVTGHEVAAREAGPNGMKPPLSSHPAFSIILMAWAAALLGLLVWVAPGLFTATLAKATGWPAFSPPIGASVAALVGACLGYAASSGIRRFQSRPVNRAKRQVCVAMADCQNNTASSVEESAKPKPEAAIDAMPESIASADEGLGDLDGDVLILDNPLILDDHFDASAVFEKSNCTAEDEVCPDVDPPEQEVTACDPAVDPSMVDSGNSIPLSKDESKQGAAVQVLQAPPVSSLSMMQLTERFAVALDDHRSETGLRRGFPSESLERLRAIQGRGKGLPAEPKLSRRDEHIDENDGIQTYVPRPVMAQQTIETEAALRDALETLGRMSGSR